MIRPGPHSPNYWSELETWPRERIAELQLRALRRQLDYAYRNSAFYRRRWQDLGWRPEELRTLDDLRALPVVDKRDYLAALAERPPWGSALAARPDDCRRVHFSSGTTASPTPVCWTRYDLDRWADLYARAAYSQGIRKHDVYQCMYSYQWFVGGLGATEGYARIGATVLPAGSGDTQRQIDTLRRFGTTAVGGTPSFMLHLAEVAAAAGTPLAESAVTRVQVGGEPGAGVPATRALIERLWGAQCFDGYGSLEFQPIAWECERQAGGHLAEDFALAEVLDPDTGQPVPDGSPGVLVLTHLDKRASPLVRWWTGDVVIRSGVRCDCGRTLARLPRGVLGRADDMLVVRGVNVFPTAVEEVVRGTEGLTGEYRIVLDADVRDPATGYLTGIKIRAEMRAGGSVDVAARLVRRVRAELTVHAVVEPVPEGSLPRATHKTARVVRID